MKYYIYIYITATNIKILILIYQPEESSFSVAAKRGFFI